MSGGPASLNGIAAATAWDLPTLISEGDRAVPDAILLNVDTPDSSTLLQLGLDLDRRVRVIVTGFPPIGSRRSSCAEAGVAGLHLRTESFEHLLMFDEEQRRGPGAMFPEVSSILLRRVCLCRTSESGCHDGRPHAP